MDLQEENAQLRAALQRLAGLVTMWCPHLPEVPLKTRMALNEAWALLGMDAHQLESSKGRCVEWKRSAAKRAKANEQLRAGLDRAAGERDRAYRWRHACLAACKHAAEWRAEAVAYMVTGAKDWGAEHARANEAEADRDRLREALQEVLP